MAFAFLSVLVTLAYYGELQRPPAPGGRALPCRRSSSARWHGRVRHAGLSFGPDGHAVRHVHAGPVGHAGRPGHGVLDGRRVRPERRRGDRFGRVGHDQRTTSSRPGTLRVGYNALDRPVLLRERRGRARRVRRCLRVRSGARAERAARVHPVRVAPAPARPRGRADSTSRCPASTRRPHRLTRSVRPPSPTTRARSRCSCPPSAPSASARASKSSPCGRCASACSTTPCLRPVSGKASCRTRRSSSSPTTGRCPTSRTIDAAIWTLEQAGALARPNAGITAVVPKDLGSPFFFTYLMPPDSQEMVHFVNYWLQLRKADGFRAREMSYWIDGQPRATPPCGAGASCTTCSAGGSPAANRSRAPGPLRPRGTSRSSRGRARARSRGPAAARSSRWRSPGD